MERHDDLGFPLAAEFALNRQKINLGAVFAGQLVDSAPRMRDPTLQSDKFAQLSLDSLGARTKSAGSRL